MTRLTQTGDLIDSNWWSDWLKHMTWLTQTDDLTDSNWLSFNVIVLLLHACEPFTFLILARFMIGLIKTILLKKLCTSQFILINLTWNTWCGFVAIKPAPRPSCKREVYMQFCILFEGFCWIYVFWVLDNTLCSIALVVSAWILFSAYTIYMHFPSYAVLLYIYIYIYIYIKLCSVQSSLEGMYNLSLCSLQSSSLISAILQWFCMQTFVE